MTRSKHIWGGVICAAVLAAGCSRTIEYRFDSKSRGKHLRQVATEIEYPDSATAPKLEAAASERPRSLLEPGSRDFWEMTLEEAVGIALSKSEAMRDLGGRVISSPETAPTIYEPAIAETDPRLGIEAALSAFDTTFTSSLFWAKNDRAVNNTFQGGGSTGILEQDTGTYRAEFNKRAATGTLFAFRNLTDYDWNNAPTTVNQFPSSWNTAFEAEIRHPFLQGGGVEFNRIAGPNATPGSFFFTNGVLLARLNTDVALTDFEAGVRNLVSDVENAYWELYFAYRDLDAKIVARDRALETWRSVHTRFLENDEGGEAEKEHQSREQYFVFQAQVENALNGIPGAAAGSGGAGGGGGFRGQGGVYVAERRLRFLLGLPPSDGKLVRPKDEPSTVRMEFEWEQLLAESLTRRVELRKQRWNIKRRELELIAARNFLLPRLDGVGIQRWRGFGDDLATASGDGNPQFNSAFQDLFDGNFQEWQLGLQLRIPIGYRQAFAGVRNAQLRVARERAVLADQELLVAHDLADSVSELDRAYVLTQTNFNRRVAARQQLEAVQVAYDAGRVGLDQVLDAQRRVADADSNYYRAQVEYNIAVKNVHFEKGSLLEYSGIYLAEGPWPKQAYADAANLARQFRPRHINYRFNKHSLVSDGVYEQRAHTGVIAERVDGQPLPEGEIMDATPGDAAPPPPQQ